MKALLTGLSFLTRIPFTSDAPDPATLGRSTRAWPAAGAVVGLCAIVALTAGAWLWGAPVGAVLAVAAMAAVTGGLHLDGFADSVDGLLCNGDAKRRLEVMHDPRAGALAAAWTAIWLMAKVGVVYACVTSGTAAAALWIAPVLARAALPWEVLLAPAATPGKGLLGALKPLVDGTDAAAATLFAVALAAPAVVAFPEVLPGLAAGLVAAAIAGVAWVAIWRDRIGGLNGDTLGAAVEIREVALLAAMGATVPG
ncbi:MAG: adenosylcobinamide-GDP ribazoletransferase [Myxococcota bacterium]